MLDGVFVLFLLNKETQFYIQPGVAQNDCGYSRDLNVLNELPSYETS